MQLDNAQHWTITRLTYWYLDRHRWAEAESLARGLLSLNQRDGRAWHYYGEARLQQDDLQEAARAFGEAARLLEDNARVWMRLGDTLLRMGRRDEARRALDEARELAEDDELVQRIVALRTKAVGK